MAHGSLHALRRRIARRAAVKQIFRQVRARPAQRLFQLGIAFSGAVFALVFLHYAHEQLFRADRQRGEVEAGVVAVEIVENGGVYGFVRVLPADAVHGIHDDLIGKVFDIWPIRLRHGASFQAT